MLKNLTRTILASYLTIATATGAGAQLVPEGVHQDAIGPVEMCGLHAADVANLLNKAKASATLRVLPIDSDRFQLFASRDGMYQLVFTRRGETAYPAATCRHTFQVADGSWHQNRSMRCGASRDACDKLFLEFRALDQQLADSFKE